MKLDNSTLKTSWELGLLDEESFKDPHPYLYEVNSSIWWRISTKFVTLSPSLSLDFNGVLDRILRDLGFWCRRMKSSMCFRLINTFKIPKRPLNNLQYSYLEVGVKLQLYPSTYSEVACRQTTIDGCPLTGRRSMNGPSWPLLMCI